MLSDPDDVYPLIPNHFLIDNTKSIIENDLMNESELSRPILINSKNVSAFLATLKQKIFTAVTVKEQMIQINKHFARK